MPIRCSKSLSRGGHGQGDRDRTTGLSRCPKICDETAGNVILLTDERAQPAARYSYDAFGQTITATGIAANLNRYRFSTKPIENGSGLAYYGYRYYDPTNGRWPSRDPLKEKAGYNMYSFVNNKSLNNTDKLGLVCWLPNYTPPSYQPDPQYSLQDTILPVRDPYGSCVTEGFYRHCVNNCVLTRYGVPEFLVDWLARNRGNDQEDNPECDQDDLNANEQGRQIGSEPSNESCADSCRESHDDAVNSQCCPSNPSFRKDSNLCSC